MRSCIGTSGLGYWDLKRSGSGAFSFGLSLGGAADKATRVLGFDGFGLCLALGASWVFRGAWFRSGVFEGLEEPNLSSQATRCECVCVWFALRSVWEDVETLRTTQAPLAVYGATSSCTQVITSGIAWGLGAQDFLKLPTPSSQTFRPLTINAPKFISL